MSVVNIFMVHLTYDHRILTVGGGYKVNVSKDSKDKGMAWIVKKYYIIIRKG